jgi:hypothetical protein
MSKRIRIDESRRIETKHASITVVADPLEITLDEAVLALGPAEAIAKSISDAIRTTGEQASAGTIRQRKAKGIGSTTKYNATGTLARGITVERDGKGYSVVAPAGRLQDDKLAQQIVEDIPEIAEPVTPKVDAAIAKTADEMIKVRRR